MRNLLAPILLLLLAAGSPAAEEPVRCEPTRPDALGPFYEPGAPLRARVGSGYLLGGSVRSALDCAPVPGAQIELWLAGPAGRYDDGHRATIYADAAGSYRFESDFPPAYGGRPPHIHMLVRAEGFRPLVTQHYPAPGTAAATFDLVLTPR
ncbi:hypothetical protein DESUT3_32860 [Desulfuromonas versatilis]|uniref:Intradiol ring-cleavage dioxygenase n=1 Tax=Desulfuromonas versatilis TaxID=2802975 RepID=A0ABN6E226_9BACT|nr:intradiol ring-cleavage dioxygenase [Desulfuromonas versatilis]BCR06217.1 hypothetical protein DESUT3_32860 [Desulfuromonas versatilis]